LQYCKSDPGCSDVWGGDGGFTASYINGRKQNSNELYDAAGNIVDKTTSATIYERWKFDAAGRNLETKMRWYWQPASQSTSFDRTEIITQTRDGDGRVVKRIDHKEGTQLPNNTTTIGETSEYYVNSTVIGNVLTELDASGAKKATNIFTGKGILAEQRNFPPDAVHPQPWSEVFWNHQDIITGSYSKVTRGGTELNVYDPPSKAEIEPLGAAVPTNDPNISDEAYEPRHLRTFAFAGDVNRPEYGCAQDGAPIPCNMLGQVLSGARSFQMEINTRFSGGWDAYYGLRASISVWHYRKSVPLPDICLGEQCSTSNVSAKHTWTWVVVKEWYEVYVAPFWELLAPQTQRNASGGGEGLNQCGKGKPCPPIKPPPPPQQKCWTIQDILNFLENTLKSAWDKTTTTRHENGGVVSVNNNGSFVLANEREGDRASMPRELPILRDIRARGDTFGIVATFHTHPSGGSEPSGIRGRSASGDYGVLNNSDGPPIGIVKHGPKKSDVTVYDGKGIKEKKDYGKEVGCYDPLHGA